MRCNYCQHEDLKRFAKQTGQEITLQPRFMSGFDGTDVLMHKPGETPDLNAHWVIWYAFLPSECRC